MKALIKKALDILGEMAGGVYLIASVVLPGGAVFWLLNSWGWVKWLIAIVIGLANLVSTIWAVSVFGWILGDITKPTFQEYVKNITPMVLAPVLGIPQMIILMMVDGRNR